MKNWDTGNKTQFLNYRSGTVNSNTVNSKFHLIRSFFETLPDSYHFMLKMHS